MPEMNRSPGPRFSRSCPLTTTPTLRAWAPPGPSFPLSLSKDRRLGNDLQCKHTGNPPWGDQTEAVKSQSSLAGVNFQDGPRVQVRIRGGVTSRLFFEGRQLNPLHLSDAGAEIVALKRNPVGSLQRPTPHLDFECGPSLSHPAEKRKSTRVLRCSALQPRRSLSRL